MMMSIEGSVGQDRCEYIDIATGETQYGRSTKECDHEEQQKPTSLSDKLSNFRRAAFVDLLDLQACVGLDLQACVGEALITGILKCQVFLEWPCKPSEWQELHDRSQPSSTGDVPLEQLMFMCPATAADQSWLQKKIEEADDARKGGKRARVSQHSPRGRDLPAASNLETSPNGGQVALPQDLFPIQNF